MAFKIFKDSPEEGWPTLNDTRYVQWKLWDWNVDWTADNPAENLREVPYHACNDTDFAKFYPTKESDKPWLKGFSCLDNPEDLSVHAGDFNGVRLRMLYFAVYPCNQRKF